MNKDICGLIEKLADTHTLSAGEYTFLLENPSPEADRLLAERAVRVRREIFGSGVYIRGLIEISNFCKNDCLYCGIRRSNRNCERYRLTPEQILRCCEEGYALGFRTFVMQGGEDAFFTDDVMRQLLHSIKHAYPDCAVTLSLGERSRESYQTLFDAGADRYLLRHETADAAHYRRLHPAQMSFDNRIRCLNDLKEIGYQVGCGFMVGSPGQTIGSIVQDLMLIESFRPQMCGVGPFIPHRDTPFADAPAGTLEMTCRLLSIIRLILPEVLLPSTTALGSLDPSGRQKGILAGANVVMPNLSPTDVRGKYTLYNNKASFGAESAQSRKLLEQEMKAIGYEVVSGRGDYPGFSANS